MGVHVPWSLEPIWRGSAAGLTATLWMERIGLGAAVSRASFGAGLEGLKAIEKVGTGPWARLHNTGAHATRPDPSSASRRARFRSPRPPLRVSRRDPLFQGVGLFSRRERAGAARRRGSRDVESGSGTHLVLRADIIIAIMTGKVPFE